MILPPPIVDAVVYVVPSTGFADKEALVLLTTTYPEATGLDDVNAPVILPADAVVRLSAVGAFGVAQVSLTSLY